MGRTCCRWCVPACGSLTECRWNVSRKRIGRTPPDHATRSTTIDIFSEGIQPPALGRGVFRPRPVGHRASVRHTGLWSVLFTSHLEAVHGTVLVDRALDSNALDTYLPLE